MNEKEENIYKNLLKQIELRFRHTRQGSKETRYRYKDSLIHFAKFMAVVYKKQNLNKIENKHIEAYIEQMTEAGYSKSTISTNISAIRFFVDQIKDSSYIKSNKELGAVAKTYDEIIGEDRAWKPEEIKAMMEIAIDEGQERIADMIQLAAEHGFRIHEVIRLERVDLQRALKDDYIRVKGKGGLIRRIPVHNKGHLQKLIDRTTVRQAKIFVYEDEKGHQVIQKAQQFIIKHRDEVEIKDEGIKGVLTFHGLRYYYAQTRYAKLRHEGLSDLEARKKVSLELGHFRVYVTNIYLNFKRNDNNDE